MVHTHACVHEEMIITVILHVRIMVWGYCTDFYTCTKCVMCTRNLLCLCVSTSKWCTRTRHACVFVCVLCAFDPQLTSQRGCNLQCHGTLLPTSLPICYSQAVSCFQKQELVQWQQQLHGGDHSSLLSQLIPSGSITDGRIQPSGMYM